MKPKLKVVFFGTPEFAQIILAGLIKEENVVLVVTQPDKPQGRSQQLVSSPVKSLALKENIPVVTPLNVADIKDELENTKADFYIVAAYGQILPAEILVLPKTNILNVHPSLLPKYRGASPIQSTILDGDAATGNSIMVVTKGLDSGPVLATSSIKIAPEDTTKTLTRKLAQDGCRLLTKVLSDYTQLIPMPQDEAKAEYTRQIKKNDGQINWQEDAARIERKIRAYNPWPVAYTEHYGLRINILAARESDKTMPAGKIEVSGHRLYVGTATRALEILTVQPAGKKCMSAKEFLNGYKKLNGQILH